MAETDGQEKSEQPSAKKLADARNKGQVAKSQEINSLAIFSMGLLIIYFSKGYIGGKFWQMSTYIFSSLDTFELSINILGVYAAKGILFFVSVMAPVLLVLFLVSLIAGYGQVGFKFTPEALMPKFSNLDPVKGFKNSFFSSRPLVELLKSLAKLGLVGIVSYVILKTMILNTVGLINFTISEIVQYMLSNSVEFLWKVSLVYLLIAVVDFIYQKRKHKKELMMTKQEVKEEAKQMEGDPHIKSKIKSKQLEMAQKRMMQEIPNADVVITNPTHYAVALKYEIGKSKAPIVVAKGMDLIAKKIKQIAKENNVPLHEDVPLARALYKSCEVGEEIPENMFNTVAQILAYIYNLKKEKKKNSII